MSESETILKRAASILTFALVLATSLSSPAKANVLQETLSIKGQDETVRTYAWSDPQIQPKMMVIGLHGAIQHGGNYTALANELAPQGVLFYSIDDRGHGNWLKQGVKRPRVDYDTSAVDLVELTEELKLEHPQIPVFCIGESLGADLAIRAQSIKPRLFDGMIFASAGDGLAMGEQWQATLKSIVQGFMTLGQTIDLTPHVTKISDDQRSTNEMINDPLCRKEASLKDLIHTVHFIHKSHRLAKKIDKGTPVLVMQGTDDHIIQPSSTRSMYKQLPTTDKTLTMFPNVGHLLVTTEYLKPEVTDTVKSWLFSHANQYQTLTAHTGSGTH